MGANPQIPSFTHESMDLHVTAAVVLPPAPIVVFTSKPLSARSLKVEVRAANIDDAVLAQALIEGEADAPALAWRRFYPVVEMTLRRMLGPDGDIEDLAQDVFLRFFRKVTGLKKAESLRSFVMAIAIRRAQEEIRRRRVRRWFAPITTQLLALPPTIEMDPEAREVIVHLYRIIDKLRLKDRTIYILRYIEGLEQAEIAQLVGISVSTVRRRLDRLTKRVNLLMNGDPVLAPYIEADRIIPHASEKRLGRAPEKGTVT
jgi:RNA polymerase sigma-70 factor, ECF subfamily